MTNLDFFTFSFGAHPIPANILSSIKTPVFLVSVSYIVLHNFIKDVYDIDILNKRVFFLGLAYLQQNEQFFCDLNIHTICYQI